MEAPLVDYENDPYFASAIEFMYSEDTEDDFGTMDAQQQEALLKKTWLEREKQFYGEDIEEETMTQIMKVTQRCTTNLTTPNVVQTSLLLLLLILCFELNSFSDAHNITSQKQ